MLLCEASNLTAGTIEAIALSVSGLIVLVAGYFLEKYRRADERAREQGQAAAADERKEIRDWLAGIRSTLDEMKTDAAAHAQNDATMFQKLHGRVTALGVATKTDFQD